MKIKLFYTLQSLIYLISILFKEKNKQATKKPSFKLEYITLLFM